MKFIRMPRPMLVFNSLHNEPALVAIFLFLRPEDLLEHDGAEHHAKDEQPDEDEQTGQDAAEDVDRVVFVQGFCDGEGCCLLGSGQVSYGSKSNRIRRAGE